VAQETVIPLILCELYHTLLDAGAHEERACTAAEAAAVVYARFVALKAPKVLRR
jgi:hypothetical protein